MCRPSDKAAGERGSAVTVKNIVLIGMPGCGKSTVGVILAKTIGAEFVDTDLVIQKREGRLLQQILDTRGVKAFLEAEEAAVRSLACHQTVIATGGSVVYSEAAMEHLRRDGTIIYLQLAYEEMMRRLDNITTRGIVIPEGSTMRDVFDQRSGLYERYADVTLPCSGRTVEETVEAIVKAV